MPKAKEPKGVHNRLKVDTANALGGAHKKGVPGEEISRIGALYLAFTEARIGLFQKLDLFLREV